MGIRRAGAFVVSFAITLGVVGALALTGVFSTAAHSAVGAGAPASAAPVRLWKTRDLTGSVQIRGEVPLSVSAGKALYVRPLPANWKVTLNFGFPITATASLNKLIMQEARSHHYITRSQLYNRYSPPQQQISALTKWLTQHGLRVTHIGADRLSLGISATAGQVQRALHVKLNEYIRPAYTFDGIKVPAYAFYANTTNPTVPARFGLQTISGLTSVDRFYTDVQVAYAHTHHGNAQIDSPAQGDPAAQVRSGGYWPSDIRSMYDVPATWNGQGQTLGFTLWGAGETQDAMTDFSQITGDQLITVLPPCTANGTPTQPSSCTTTAVGADQLMTILENGNTNNNFGGNDETGLDIEQAHGIATHAGMKYYDGDCETSPPVGSGLSNGNSCNGSDVGLEDAVEDAANDPTLHTVSNSWLYGGDPEWALADPFVIATQNSLMIADAAGTTFYFSTGDTGTYEAGYPADSPYVVGVGGTSLFSSATTSQLSTETTWAAGGSWCSSIFARPAWQTGAGVTANADCPNGRADPDVSAVADTNTAVREVYSTGATNFRSGSVGGTSVAAPEWNGLTAVLEDFVGGQSYTGKAPAIGFTAPTIYKLGNSNQNAYYRDVVCGNNADPTGSPDGSAALPGWDQATGWGAPDFLHFATGYAMALGATNLTTPSSTSQNYSWTCARTPTNASLRSVSFASTSVGYAVGASASAPWYSTFLPSGSWGADDTVYSTGDGGQTWTPSNADMLSVACASSSSCVEVGDGGVIKTTSNGGSTWSNAQSGFDKGLTQVTCPSSSICYAAGDRGFVLKSTNAGQSWSYLSSTDGNPIYGLYCVNTQICYATDIYAHIIKTTDGGNTWAWQTTPVTTPGVGVPGSGGPNPFAGLFGVSCVDAAGQDCVAVGGFPPTGSTAPIVATTNGGATWTSDNVTAPSGDWLAAVACLPGTTTCYAVGRNGTIVTTTDMVSWTTMTSNTTNMLNDITCSSTTSCVAVGQNGTVDVLTGSSWAATTGIQGGLFLAGISCYSAGDCYAVGKEGITMQVAVLSPTSVGWNPVAGNGIAAQMNAISCPSTSTCFAVGNPVGSAGSMEATTDGGQLWVAQQSTGNSQTLNGVSCTSTSNCVAVGNLGVIEWTTSGGNPWTKIFPQITNNNLAAVSCSGSDCTAVGASGTIVNSSNAGQSWTVQNSNTTTALNAVTCPTTSTCFATGAIPAGQSSAIMLATTNGGATWTTQTSNSPQALSAITCLDAFNCFAGGAGGTVITTNNGGATWTQQGNPLSGPTSALNATVSSLDAINAVGCNSSECAMGTGSSGDIMITPLLTVTINATQTAAFSINNITNVPANSPSISYSPASQAPNVTGTLTCTTTATPTSPTGSYPISNCSGLSANGYSIVYNYAASSYTVAFPTATPVVNGTVPSTLSVSIASTAPSFGAFTAGITQTYSATTNATITSSAATATLQAADQTGIDTGHLVNSSASGGPYQLAQPLQVAASDPSNTTGSGIFGNLTSPVTLLTYNAPTASDPVTITFQQLINSTDPLRTGTYTKTITFTLSTSTP